MILKFEVILLWKVVSGDVEIESILGIGVYKNGLGMRGYVVRFLIVFVVLFY